MGFDRNLHPAIFLNKQTTDALVLFWRSCLLQAERGGPKCKCVKNFTDDNTQGSNKH